MDGSGKREGKERERTNTGIKEEEFECTDTDKENEMGQTIRKRDTEQGIQRGERKVFR